MAQSAQTIGGSSFLAQTGTSPSFPAIVVQTGTSPSSAGKTGTSPSSIVARPIDTLRPSPENDRLYRPVDRDDPEIIALAESIAEHGVREPLVATLEGWILSGHRRHAAARLAGLKTVPCRIEPIRRADDIDHFVKLLREYNRQRDKTADEKLREELVSANPDEAYEALLAHRRQQAQVATPALAIVGQMKRCEITDAKLPMLNAHSFARSMRDDFFVENIHAIKVALTAEQVERYHLPPNMTAKEQSANYKKFVARHGRQVFEVEALQPAQLQDELRRAIDAVIDVPAFNAELNREKLDAAYLSGVRTTVHKTLRGLGGTSE